ncbi:unnamed protein product [Rhizoctonia solani]|uniref:Zn(2)-C6 fungal-type domain-containing protein n=1 Tax=Rhizoctonia solani TaxID=456999 RepID=A0A8H2ZW84_9AGAM|nr:unnamed protein product [Rhizoctonia solani]
MPPSQIRSRSGCLTCKSRRKKCDETKPFCQRCQHSGIQCTGYSYLGATSGGNVVKNWTQPAYSMSADLLPPPAKASRTAKRGRSHTSSARRDVSNHVPLEGETPGAGFSARPSSHEWSSTSDTSPDLFNSPFDLDPTISSSLPTSQALEDWWNLDPSLPLLAQPDPSSSTLQHQPFQSLDTTTSSEFFESSDSQNDQAARSLTAGQASLFNALFSLSDQTANSASHDPPTSVGYPPTHLPTCPPHQPTINVGVVLPDGDDDDDKEEDETVKQIICGTMKLGINAEGNTLPFILESYAAWVTRTAFEPKKAALGARDLIFKQFGDSDESRWTLTTLAKILRSLAEKPVWGEGLESLQTLSYQPAVRALREQVRQRVNEIMLHAGSMESHELSKALKTMDNVMEIASIYYTTTSVPEALDFMRMAAPLFRFLCSDHPNKIIHLQSLLLQPVLSLRHYALVDIFSSVAMEREMIFHYDTTYNPNLTLHMDQFPSEAGIQWLHGIPGVIIITFARINMMREQGYADPQAITEMETMLRRFVVSPSLSNDPFLTVARVMVQECWRQAAYIYLYMGACHVNADDPRVKRALSKLMKLLDGTKPGRTPDAFLMLQCMIGGIAARSRSDREVIRQRMLSSERFKFPGAQGSVAVMLLDYIWLRTDGERRPAVWGDLRVATKQASQRSLGWR